MSSIPTPRWARRCPAWSGSGAIHVCDGDPSASGYRGLPAVEATRKGIATFRRTFGPLVLLGTEPGLETLGTTAVVWREGEFANPLCRVLQAALSA